MRFNIQYILIILSIFSIAHAADPHIVSFLSGYNISASTANSFTYTNITYSGNSYVLAYSGGTPKLLINTTHGYSFVLNAADIASIITNTTIKASLAQINTTYLTDAMHSYDASSAAPLTDCVIETGISTATCTVANECQSCEQVPVCRKVLLSTGIYGPLVSGIIQFEGAYGQLNSNYSTYFSSLSNLNASNAQSSIPNIEKTAANISSITSTLGENPLFPPTKGLNFAACGNYGAATSNVASPSGPWYCSALGFCEFLSYNASTIGNIQTYISSISGLPISKQQILQVAQNVSSYENTYIAPVTSAKQKAKLNEILNKTLGGYNTTVSNANTLLSHISNATLSNDLLRLEYNYTYAQNNYLTANFTSLNSTFKSEYNALKSSYMSLNSSYSYLVSTANNNTALLIELQSGQSYPQQLSSLSFQEAQINQQLGGSIQNVSSVKQKLLALSKQLASLSAQPSILQDIVRAVDAPIATAILGSQPFSAAVGLVPLVSLIPSIIIGAILLAALFAFHRRLRRSSRIAANPRTNRNWNILFIFAFILFLAFLAMTYYVSAAANSNSQLYVARDAIISAKAVAIAYNGTINPSMTSCANRLSSILKSEKKAVYTITLNGLQCSTGSSFQTTDSCLSSYASSGIPIIILTNSTKNTLTAYSFFGTILGQSGTPQFTNSCLSYLFIK